MEKQIKIVLIGLVIFTLVSIATTSILIKNKTQNVYTEKNTYQYINKEIGIDLYGMYDENDLLINELIEVFRDEEIKIPQIEGLKNVNIQKKINKDMYDKCHKLLNSIEIVNDDAISNLELGTMNSADNYETYYNVMANFSNVISIHYIVYTNEYSDSLYFNYNLVTGESLKLEDLFVKDTDILDIVRRAFYSQLTRRNYLNEEDDWDYVSDPNAYELYKSPDENELYKIVKGYMNTLEKEFMFSPSKIYFNLNNSGANMNLIDIADKVSIYSKYLTNESIFEKNDIGRKDIFTLAETHYDLFETIDYGYLEDNFWYDITVSKMYFPDGEVLDEKMENFNAYAKTLTNEAYKKVNEYREKAKNNLDKFYILICTPNVSMYNDAKYTSGEWTYTYSNMAISNINTKVYEMPIELYNEEYKDKIINAYRHEYFIMRGGMYYTIDEPTSGENVVYTKTEEQRKYNYMTNKEITELSEIFYEDVNYMEILEKKVRRELIENYNYSVNETEELLKSAQYDFQGWNIKVDIPQIEYFSLNIYLETFDKSMLNIFDKEPIPVENEKEINTEYAFITDDNKRVILNEDINLFDKEPISEIEGRGDGFHWKDYIYDDIEIHALIGDDGIERCNRIITTSKIYKTPREIKVGDTLLKLQEAYPKHLENGLVNLEKSSYIYDNEDEIGFNRIFFELENDIITKITIENGIDG